ncbi:MAG: chloride channel protein [Candidatus Lambdaproteobacteria bacterium]|nr:chloride channel protein [Candidatus Lambdaproteobacteria bacterium]
MPAQTPSREDAPAAPGVRIHRISAREAAVLMVLAIPVGLASGVSAVVLSLAVHHATAALMGWQGHWWLIGVPAVGAALSALYLKTFLHDDAGHGVPELIRAVSVGAGHLRRDLVFSRLISSFLTISSGGSAGLEGPIATSGGAIGSLIARALRFSERRRILLLGYGVAGAVAAIFNAPLTGTVFALEVILGEWSALAILPTIIAAVSATQFSRLTLGNQIAFPHEVFAFGTLDLLACMVLGLMTGLLSVGFQRSLRFTEVQFDRLRAPFWAKAGTGGLLVGLGGFFLPAILYDGYDAIQRFLQDQAGISLLFLGAFVVLKFAACCLTLGSGGSGGVFAPSLVLGSATGYGFGRLLRLALPGFVLATPNAYSLVGMAGMVAGLMHAPLTGMFLVLEITVGYRLILPLMMVAVLSMLVSFYFELGSVYTRELVDHGLLARRGSDQQLLRTMEIRELLDAEDIVLHEHTLLGEFVEIFKNAKRNIFPVVDERTGRWQGVVYLDDIRPYLFDRTLYSIMNMGSVMDESLPTIESNESALTAIQKFESSGAWSLPVVDNGVFLGMMSKSTLFDRYRRELIVQGAT